MDLEQAIEKHAEWKLKLRLALTRREHLDVESVAHDDRCDLGRWLYGDGQKHFGTLLSFGDCLRKHADFHLEAARVARAINDGRYDEAEAMLNGTGPYASASSSVGVAIMRLRKEAKL